MANRIIPTAAAAAPRLLLAPARRRPPRIPRVAMAPAAAAAPPPAGRRTYRSSPAVPADATTASSPDGTAPAAAAGGGEPFRSPRVESLFGRIVALDRDRLNAVGDIIADRLGVTIIPGLPAEAAAAGGGDAAAEEEAEEEVRTAFDLKLVSFDAKSKIKVIKEVRSIAGLGLKEAKEVVEGAPKVVKKDIKTEEAEELKKKLEALGATVELV